MYKLTKRNELSLVLPLPPVLNKLYRYGSGRCYMAQEGNDFKQAVRYQLCVDYRPCEIPLGLEITFHVKRDRDIDSGLKVLLDSLQGLIYENDRQVKELLVRQVKTNKDNVKTVLFAYPLT